MTLSIIIVNYNTGALTKACLESLLGQPLPKDSEIIVVDNASNDETVPFLRSDFPEIKIISNTQNLGLAAAVNQGIAAATGDFYLILNPDTIALPHSVMSLLDFMQKNPDVGIAGGKLISPNGSVQYSCYRYYRPMTVVYRRTLLGKTRAGQAEIDRFLMKDFDRGTTREVDWLMGACLMVRARAVKKIGGMDERFFLYFEDVDWCRRFKEAGYRVVYFPGAQFSHYHQRSSEQGTIVSVITNRAVRHHILSALKYFWKYR